jgi:HEPN domain-containing protein
MLDNLDHARAWAMKGDSDLLTTRHLLNANGPFDTACFHAQQAVEKYLKALLAMAGQTIPLSHNLEEIDRRCAAAVPAWATPAVDLAQLTVYAVQSRYDFSFWPARATAEEARDAAELVRAAVISLLPERARP